MSTTAEVQWEDVCEKRTGRNKTHLKSQTTRLAVPGGWLYQTIIYGYDEYYSEGPVEGTTTVFVPDPKRVR